MRPLSLRGPAVLLLAVLLPLGACDVGVELDPALADAPLPRPDDPIDPALADAGAWLFRRNCAACHHLGEGSMIGPDLAGVTRRRDPAWIAAMIRNPDSMLAVDTLARRLLAQYQVPMANRRLDGARVRALMEFLRRADLGPVGSRGAPMAIDTTDAGIAWDRRGAGPTVVLLHGTNLDRRIWRAVADSLVDAHTVVRLDLRSHGASADAAGPWSDLDDLAGVLDAAGVDAATLVGLSAGAGLALEFALQHPDRVAGLVLVSPSVRGFVPAPGEVPDVFGPLMRALPTGDSVAIGDVLAALPTFEVGPEARSEVQAMVRANLRLFRVDPAWMRVPPPPLERLAEVAVPTRVLFGTGDFPATASLARRLADGIAGATLVELPGAPHLIPVTHPGAVAAAVDGLVENR